MSSQEENVAKIIAKAAAEPAFKAALLENPVKAIESALKLELPPKLTVKVLQDTPTLVHFALPTDHRMHGDAPGKIHRPAAPEDPERQKRQQLYEKAWSDAAFRKKLLSQPKETLSRELGVSWPDGVEVRAFQDTDKVAHLILPLPKKPAAKA